MQKLLRPLLYIALVSAVMIPVDFGVDELYAIMGKISNTSSADEQSTMRTIRTVAAVLYFYVLQTGVCIIGIFLVHMNRVVACHAFDTTINFLVGTPLMFLNGLIAFTPWTGIILKGWGAKLPWASVHLNTLCSVAPSCAEYLRVGCKTCLFSPILDPVKGGIVVGANCFVALGARIDGGGTRIGDGAIVDTLAHVPAGGGMAKNTHINICGAATYVQI